MDRHEGSPDLATPKLIPHGLVNLAEMVNFNLWGICSLCGQLMFEVVSLHRAINDRGEGRLK